MNTRPAATKISWLVGAAMFVVVAVVTALVIGPTSIDRTGTLLELLDSITPGDIDSGLDERQISIVRNLRLPRIPDNHCQSTHIEKD